MTLKADDPGSEPLWLSCKELLNAGNPEPNPQMARFLEKAMPPTYFKRIEHKEFSRASPWGRSEFRLMSTNILLFFNHCSVLALCR